MDHRLSRLSAMVAEFIRNCKLLPPGGRICAAVSGGRDSVLLLLCLQRLRSQGLFRELDALHFNHGIRPHAQQAEELSRRWCHRLGVPLEIGRGQVDTHQGNVEARCRKLRYDFFRRFSNPEDRVYLGHHLDDSFEWSLLARLKSANVTSQLGIPVINERFARPFLCVRRRQLDALASRLKLEYVDDPGNLSVRFERNFLRHQIIPKIAARFPGYLRHYVHASNELARRLGTSRLPSLKGLVQVSLPPAGVALLHPQGENIFVGEEGRIRGIIEGIGRSRRGRLSSQIAKLIAAAKAAPAGPVSFSAGVRGFAEQGSLFFVHDSDLPLWRECDRLWKSTLQKTNVIPPPVSRDSLLQWRKRLPFPGWGFGRQEDLASIAKSRRRPHPLLPQSTNFALKRGLWAGPLAHLLRSGQSSFKVFALDARGRLANKSG